MGDSEDDNDSDDSKDWYLLNLRMDKTIDRAAKATKELSNLNCFDEDILLDKDEASVNEIKLRVMFESCSASWYTAGACKSRA